MYDLDILRTTHFFVNWKFIINAMWLSLRIVEEANLNLPIFKI